MLRGLACLPVALASVLMVVPVPTGATPSIQPAYVEMDLDQGRSSEPLVVTNMAEQETRYRDHVRHFDYTPDGGIQRIPPDEHSRPTSSCGDPEMKLGSCESRLSRRAENSGGNDGPEAPGERPYPFS